MTPLDALASREEVLACLKSLAVRKASSDGDIPNRFLKKTSEVIASAVAILINSTLLEQSIPQAWKRAIVTSVPKSAQPSSTEHYRPISLLPSIAKIWERRFLLRRLEPFLAVNELQFGFRERSGCGDALLRLQQAVLESAVKKEAVRVAVVSLDVSRAFDTLKHTAILETLISRGIPPHLLNIVASWLEERSFA